MANEFLLPGEEDRMQSNAARPAVAAATGSLFLLPGERTATESALPVLRAVGDTDPDAVGNTRRMSRATGLPEAVVERNPERAKTEARLSAFRDMLPYSPALARSLAKPEFAKVAHDDVDNLANIGGVVAAPRGPERAVTSDEFARMVRDTKERNPTMGWDEARASVNARVVVDNTPGGVVGTERSTLGGLIEPIRRGFAQAKQFPTLLASELGLYSNAAPELGVRLAQQQRAAGRFPLPEPLQQGMAEISNAATMGEAVGAILRNPRAVLEVSLQSVGASAPAMLGAVAGSALGPVGTGVGAGVGSFLVEYASTMTEVLAESGANLSDPLAFSDALANPELMSKAREKGVKRGIPIALFDGLTAGLAGKLLLGAKPTVGSIASRVAGEGAVQAAGGAAGEAVAQAVTGEYKPGDILLEALAEIPTGLVEVYSNVRTAKESADRSMQTAENDAQALDGLLKLITASKVRERDVSSLQAYIDEAAQDGPVQEVFVPAQVFAQAAGENLDVFKQLMPSVGEQLDASLATNSDLIIPIGEFAANVVGTGMESALIDHIRTGVNAPSRAEAQEYMQSGAAEELKKNIEQQMEKAITTSEEKQSAAKVEADLLAQLKEANRFTDDVNALYAKATTAFYATTAKRLAASGKAEYAGMTAEKAAQMFPLGVRAEGTGQGSVLDQKVDLNTPEFKAWFGGSKVVDAEGRPLVVHRGESEKVTTYKTSKLGKVLGGSLRKAGFFFTPSEQEAGFYAQMRGSDIVNSVYLAIENPYVVDRETWKELADWGSLPSQKYKTLAQATKAAVEMVDRAKAAGHDGLFLMGGKGEVAEYVAFRPEQIKSATDNSGAFDPNNPNILKQSVSTRVPTAKKATENPLSQRLQIGLETFKDNPDAFDTAVKLLTSYVNWHPNPRLRGADARAEKFIGDVVQNLLWLHDQVPAEIRERSKKWYDGANVLANTFAERYGVTVAQAAGILAVNSPQTEWFTNVSRAERILDIWTNQQDFVWSKEMDATASRILGKEQYAEDLAAMRGKTLAELSGDSVQQAMWVRVFDESHNPRKFRIVTPEGAFGDFVKTAKGADAVAAWASFGHIAKSIEIIQNGSIENISLRLGNEHKVRSFYNNIFSPADPVGDVTIDTHAVAAGLLRPLSGSSIEVEHNLGAGVGSALQGISGTYGVYAEAYRRAAAQRGILPREMQSITWEAVRGLYTDVFKRSAGAGKVEQAWADYRAGKIDEATVRAKISEIAGGINEPNWWQSDSRPPTQTWSSSYGGELSEFRVPGPGGSGGGGDAGGGAGGARSRGIPGAAVFAQGGVSIPDALRAPSNPVPPATSSDFSKQGVGNILAKGNWTILTAANPDAVQLDEASNAERMDALRARLKELGLEHFDVQGKYGNEEPSIVVVGATREQAVSLGVEFGQQSVLTRDGLVYRDGTVNPARKVEVFDTAPEDFYTKLPDGTTFAIDIDFDRRLPLPEGTARVGETRVAGVHFSKTAINALDTGRYGTGMKDAGFAKTMASPDTRMHKRGFFYVNEGAGVRAEKDVGSVAHVARLDNLYDAEADPLGIWKSGGESAVLDAGFSGYYARGSFALGQGKTMGSVVLLGKQLVPVSTVGSEATANAFVAGITPPAPQYTDMRLVANELLADPRLPAGQLTPPEWKNLLGKLMPDLAAKIPDAAFGGTEPVYRDQLARTFMQPAQTNARGQISFATDITQSASTITLLKNADLSTFLHELGHFQLEVLATIASQPNAPAEIAQDMERILKWFGVADLATWNAMTLEEKRPHHEQFARGFEAYLFEGKAPSVELKGAFARIRAWMIAVYKEISALNVQLTDEVRGVFDRLIASEQQIAEAEALRGYAPLFKSAEEMGATPEEWAEYQAQAAEATEEAVASLQSSSLRDMRWITNARSRTLRKLQKDSEGKRRQIEAEVRDEVQQEPVYAAIRWLKTGVLSDGTQTVGAKLDIDALRKMYGDSPAAPWRYLNTGPQGLAGREGMHPDQIAGMFGFTSGDHLVRAILAAEPEASVIEGLTDRRMLERYGELATPQAIERAVDEALHNEARARFIATELRALDKATKTNSRAMAKAAKAFAEQIIARKKVRDVKPAKFTAAEARAARAAEKAKGLTEKATEKRNQLVNHYAARSAQDALADIQKGLALFERASTSESIDIGYREQIAALLERFDLRSGTTLKAIDKRTALADWIKSQEDMGFEPVISDELRNEAFRKSYKDMTVEEFRGLVDTVKNIEHLGRLKHKLLTIADKREFAAVVGELVKSIEENATGTVPERRASDRGPLVEVGQLFRNFLADHRKFASLAREMDGWKDAGLMWDYLVRAMNSAGDKEATMREQATIKLSALMAPILKQGGLGKKTFFDKAGKSFTREEVLGIALNMGNEVNRERVVSGEGLNPAALEQVLNTLDKKDWDFVQGVWDYLETFRPEIAAKERRLTGTEPEWVEPAPITTRFGVYKGGYYPIKYDPLRSSRAEADSASEVQRQLERGLYTRSQTRRGHLKARTESTGRPLRYDLGVIVGHVDQVVHDLAWHEYLIDANRLLRALDGTVREYYGPEKLRAMKDTLTDIAVGDLAAKSSGDRILNHLRHSATVAGLGWRVSTSLLQPLGLTQSAARIGSKWVLKGAYHWMGDAFQLQNSVRIVGEKSEFMRLRAKTMQREINEIRNKVAGKDSAIEASYFLLIQKAQVVADLPTWWGQYEKAMAEKDMTEAKAIALADQAVRDSQGGGQIGDLAGVQRGSAAWRLFTNFYSFFNTTYNLTRESFGRTKSLKDVPMLVADLLLLYTVPAMLSTLLKATLAGDWDDEEKLIRRLIADQLNYLFGTLVLVRETNAAIQAAAGLNADYSGPASVRLFNDLSKLFKQTAQGELDEAFWKSLNSVGGDIFGYPAGQINATASGLRALAEGDTINPGVLLVGAQPK